MRIKLILATTAVLAAANPAFAQSVVRPNNNVGFPVDWQEMPTCTGQPSQPVTCASSYYTSRYKLSWQDEFNFLNAGADGASARWFAAIHTPFIGGDWMATYNDATAYSVSGGQLQMTSYWSGAGSNAHYMETDLQSADRHGRGFLAQNFYAEVRARGPQQTATHSGIWFLSMDYGASDTTGGHTELDMLEQYGPGDQFDHASSHIWPGNTGGAHIYASTGVVRPEGKAVNWHTYGLLATDSVFTLFRDGVATRTIARQPKQRVPLYIVMTLFPNPSAATPGTAYMQVDYVRVYLPS